MGADASQGDGNEDYDTGFAGGGRRGDCHPVQRHGRAAPEAGVRPAGGAGKAHRLQAGAAVSDTAVRGLLF